MDKTGHTQIAYQGIRRLLFLNELSPGQKITIRELAERLGMSQTPVIQALKWLEFQQLVRHEPNRGYFLEPISIQEVSEVYELRELIELSLLPKVMERMNASVRKKLQSALNDHLQATREFYLYDRLSKDMEFHLTLARLSGCRVQERTLANLFDILYLKYGASVLFTTSMDSADADHKSLFEAMGNNDLKAAKRILSSHIKRVKKHVLGCLQELERVRQQTSI